MSDTHHFYKIFIEKQMTIEESRKAFPNRPFSDFAESPYGGNKLLSDAWLIHEGHAKYCRRCSAPTKRSYLTDGLCPDCMNYLRKTGLIHDLQS